MAAGPYEKATAIVLIVTAPGREEDVYAALRRIPEVTEQLLLFGEYDLFAKLECSDYGVLGGVVINQIRSIEGVEGTKTLTAAPVRE